MANAGANVTIETGQSTTLIASGGDTYLWSNGATSASITVNPTATRLMKSLLPRMAVLQKIL